ncbi:uncharacterized protein LOC105839361 isoform X2 [Monomorium pharaonis]|uniref:uncharacterized protein LOC105839361 isoform X2 n=1 Tax=Monomorium pharaonis TaxID=307658 RepID=UPI00174798FE|nr:uncharacterized protein LOC105839361 isoform X2 [Monomorium pharaonis]
MIASCIQDTSISRGYLIYRTISTTRQSCNCSMSFSCSCCQSVMILYTRKQKDLCINFTYQRNGLNVDVSLSSETISTRTVTNFKAFQFCVFVPGCLFSTACVNILELNQFPKSITACLRLDIYAKKRLWQINYDCISVSMELPMISTNDTMRMTETEESSTAESEPTSTTMSTVLVTEMSSSEMAIVQTSEMTEMTDTNRRPEEVEDVETYEISEEITPIK